MTTVMTNVMFINVALFIKSVYKHPVLIKYNSNGTE